MSAESKWSIRLFPLHWFIAALFIFLCFFLPLAYGRFGYFETKYLVFFAWFGAVLISPNQFAILRKAIKSRRLEVLFLFVWLMVVLFNFVGERGTSGERSFRITLLGCMAYLLGLYYSAKDRRLLNGLLMVLLCTVAIWTAMGLPIIIEKPWLPRIVTGQYAASIEDYAHKGVGDYAAYTTNALVLAVLLGLVFRQKLKWLPLLMIVFAPVAISPLFTTLAGNMFLVIASLGLFFSMQLRRFSIKARIGIVALGLVAIAFFPWDRLSSRVSGGTQVKGLGEDMYQNPLLYAPQKIMRLFTGVKSEGVVQGDETGRGQLLQISLDTFQRNMLFGVGPYFGVRSQSGGTMIGGHSSWIDSFAEYGIVGFLPYVVFLTCCIIRTFKVWNKSPADPLYDGALISIGLYTLYGFPNPVLLFPEMTPMIYFTLGSLAPVFIAEIERPKAPVAAPPPTFVMEGRLQESSVLENSRKNLDGEQGKPA